MTRAARIRTSEHRRHIPLGVKLQACLLLLGFTEDEIRDGQIDFDHFPALGLRVVDGETGLLRPLPNDPRYIRPLRKADHKVKTFGIGGTKRVRTSGGDIHAMAQAPRLRETHDAFRARQDIMRDDDAKPAPPKKRSRLMPGSRGTAYKRTISGKTVLRSAHHDRP